MTDLPAGPDLDREVAIAMGIDLVVVLSKGTELVPAGKYNRVPQTFSTDPRHIDEMLAWLPHDDGCMVRLEVALGSKPPIDAFAVRKWDEEWLMVSGDTIPEALSRLVVAVKEASGG